MSALRQETDRRGFRTHSSSSLGTPQNKADRYRISTASTHLFVRLLHLWRIAERGAGRASRAAAHRLYGAAHGLLSPIEAPSRLVLEHDSPPACQRRLDGAVDRK